MTKYAIIVPDGAADEPMEQFGDKTVLQIAETPNMDKISTEGRQGLVRTIPEGLEPGSDIAQMSLLGYDPVRYYSGRAPIEAVIKELEDRFGNEQIRFYAGVSYRHLLVFKGLNFDVQTHPPHDCIGTAVEKILPRGKGAELLIDLTARSQQLFRNHDINKVRRDLGENQVSSIWLWGQGKKAKMESFRKRFGIKGATTS